MQDLQSKSVAHLRREIGSRQDRDAGEQVGTDGIVRFTRRGRDVIVHTDPSWNRSAGLLSVAIECVRNDRQHRQSLLILPEAKDVQSVEPLSNGEMSQGRLRIVHLGPADDARAEAGAASSKPDVVVTTPKRLIDHIRRDSITLSSVAVCVLAPPTGTQIGQYSADLHYIYTKFDREPATILFTSSNAVEMTTIEDLIRRPVTVFLRVTDTQRPNPNREPKQEQTEMANRDLPFDSDSTAQQLRDIVRRIHEDEDRVEMNQYKRFIKKHVSIFDRAYFTAYLFKQLAAGPAASSDQATIFVSAGRNRRVHPRDLVTLFTSADGVSRDDIGQIKVLDNYSFVELEVSKAKQAIDALDGTDFRGRKLTVNFSKKK